MQTNVLITNNNIESGNMILMALVHSRATSDTNTILEPYYHLFRQWANYLVNSTLIPGFQYQPLFATFNQFVYFCCTGWPPPMLQGL